MKTPAHPIERLARPVKTDPAECGVIRDAAGELVLEVPFWTQRGCTQAQALAEAIVNLINGASHV